MSQGPLMPKATAVWLVENTSLSFEQIADFCKLHPLEVKGIADGEVAAGIKGSDPITIGPADPRGDRDGQGDPNHRLRIAESQVKLPEQKRVKKGPRYTPVSRRHDRPNAILWLVRNHPELKDAQIMRLVGTTKTTIQQVRERTHWNSASLSPDGSGDARPVLADRSRFRGPARRQGPAACGGPGAGGTLMPAEVSTAPEPARDEPFADMSRPKPVQEEKPSTSIRSSPSSSSSSAPTRTRSKVHANEKARSDPGLFVCGVV